MRISSHFKKRFHFEPDTYLAQIMMKLGYPCSGLSKSGQN